ncbi:MAG TPA: hypothetical protein VGP92_19160, partial [Acidimicrobiia bacterium]|nr:hypothetical protein [Acidimicrobiia bacterium]
VALFPFAHIFRAGSRVRITVEAPGGNRPFWAFGDLPATGTVVDDVAHSIGMPSQLVLPVIPNPPSGIPAALPACGSVRGEPCRTIVSKGAPVGVEAVGNGTDATVSWTAAVPRAGDTVSAYHLTEQPDGKTLDVPGTATSALFTGLSPGPHHFTLSAEFGKSHAVVAATGANDVTIVDEPPSSTTTTVTTETTTTTSASTTTTTNAPTTSTTVGTTGTGTTTTVTVIDVGTTASTTIAGVPTASGGLPFTGSGSGSLAAFGALATVFGAALLARRRRRPLT